MEKRTAEEDEEEIRKRDEKEIEDDYNQQAGEVQGRDIEHLVLVTHGIGQRLGLRFVHSSTPQYNYPRILLTFGVTQYGKREFCS